MRQVNQDELVNVLQASIRKARFTELKALQHHDATERLRARVAVAEMIAGDMKRFEILTTAPPPPPFRYGALTGTTGAPPIDDD